MPAEYIIKEHYRLGSTCVILSRSFCNTKVVSDIDKIRFIFDKGVQEIREKEEECESHANYFRENKHLVADIVKKISQSK